MANNTAVIKNVFGPRINLVIRAWIYLNRLRKKPRIPYFFFKLPSG
jgi:hypothetical protein